MHFERFHPARALVLISILCAALATGCATSPDQEEELAEFEDVNDPLESLNRGIFEFNRFADGILIKPLALMYRTFIPPEVRRGTRNFLENLRTPVTLANDLMQGKMERAGNTIGRFVINSTVGIGGVMDMADRFGMEGHREDFGQTLAVWGTGEGFYLMLPLFGPSNPRDVIGLVADAFLDPLSYVLDDDILATRTVVRGVDERESVIDTLDEIERTSLDFYATLRSLYRQRRDDEIRDGAPAPLIPIPSISIKDFEDFEEFEEDGHKVSLVN
ncbi:MAG: VacJ family lipoprotein [Alphaproteobacteria bacterium]